jgi:hypothetical protein
MVTSSIWDKIWHGYDSGSYSWKVSLNSRWLAPQIVLRQDGGIQCERKLKGRWNTIWCICPRISGRRDFCVLSQQSWFRLHDLGSDGPLECVCLAMYFATARSWIGISVELSLGILDWGRFATVLDLKCDLESRRPGTYRIRSKSKDSVWSKTTETTNPNEHPSVSCRESLS